MRAGWASYANTWPSILTSPFWLIFMSVSRVLGALLSVSEDAGLFSQPSPVAGSPCRVSSCARRQSAPDLRA
eukprot:2189760-Rhodomonas_salina.5